MPVADEDRTAAATLDANYKRIAASLKEAAAVNRKMLTELKELRERNARYRRRIETLEAANRELRVWRDLGQRIKAVLREEDVENAEPVSADGPVSGD